MKKIQHQSLLIGIALIALMALTRGSHVGTEFSFPDASLAVIMLGGLLLGDKRWFVAMMLTAVGIDAFAVGVSGVSSYCMSPAYWALLPTYAVMWMGGAWLKTSGQGFNLLPFALTGAITTTIAFVISTHSFYLFSGRVPEASLMEVLQHGWEYFPAYFGFTMMYLAASWLLRRALIANSTRQGEQAVNRL